MSEERVGTVAWCGSTRARSGSILWSFKLQEDEDTFFRCGTFNPKVRKGDYIKFNFTEDPKWGIQADTRSIAILKAAVDEDVVDTPAAAERTTSPAKQAPNKAPKEDWNARAKYWDNKEQADVERQQMISFQAAVNTAVSIVDAAVKNEFITIAGRKGDVKYDAFVAMVMKQAEELFRAYQTVPQRFDELMIDGATDESSAPTFDDLENEDDFNDD